MIKRLSFKNSISIKLFFVILTTIMLVLLSGWLVMTYYSEYFYAEWKMDDFVDKLHELAYSNENNSGLHINMLNKMCTLYGVSAVIEDEQENILYKVNNPLIAALPEAALGGRGIRWYLPKPGALREMIEGDSDIVSKKIALPNSMVLTLSMSLQVLESDAGYFRRILLYLLPVGLALAVIASFIMSWLVARPLKQLSLAAVRMEKLDFSVRCDEQRGDEIGHLSRTLNRLMDKLGLTLGELRSELEKEKNLDQLRKRFVAQVSHELKTPISILSSYSEALADGIMPEDERDEYYSVMLRECKRMDQMLEDILDLSRLESGTLSILLEKIDGARLVRGVFDKYDEVVIRDITLTWQGPDKEVFVRGDMLRLEQVMDNYMQNAIKNTHDAGRIEVRVLDGQDDMSVEVFNTGNPIPDDIMPHIWESFIKQQNTKGSGLGLSISRHILKLHDAQYYAHNLQNGVLFGFRISKA